MANETVSVIVPVYNGAAHLKESVESALQQTHKDLQVIIVNDGSTDSSGEIAEILRRQDDRVEVVHQENMGLSAARNSGLSRVVGSYVNFLDADDWLYAEKIRVQLDALRKYSAHGLVYSDYVRRQGDEEFPVLRGVPSLRFSDMLSYRNWFAPMVPLIRRSLIDKVGEFDTSMKASEDWDYWYRCAQHTEFLYLPGVVAAYRLHANQMTKDRGRMNEGQLRFAQKHLLQTPRRYRAFRTYKHMSNAKQAKSTGQFLRCALELGRFALAARSIKEARFVWRMPP